MVIGLNIRMAGIDYSMAGIPIREQFSFTKSCQQKIYELLKQNAAIVGAVILSTCNRTELYLSCREGYTENPFLLLCNAIDVNFFSYRTLHKEREGDAAFVHLCQLSCGAKSQIWGEDQIISQVKNSLLLARENNAADSVLEVMFRTAITAAKKIKTEIRFSQSESSVAARMMEILQRSKPTGRKVLVIGNGEVGKLAAERLLENGFAVTMTLRQYKYSEVQIPQGATAVEYNERYDWLSKFDVLVSATLSPHYTIEREQVGMLKKYPRLMFDLAVPRDIEPEVATLPGVTLYDIDRMGDTQRNESHEKQLAQMNRIIEKYQADFAKWSQYKELITT